MIQTEDIKKLANLARIEMSETELAGLAGDLDSILAYVDDIKKVSDEGSVLDESSTFGPVNSMREDTNAHESGAYTESCLAEAHKTRDNYVVVKKIL